MSPAPTDDPTEASLRPPEPAREISPLRWAGLLVALLALALAAWHGWGWLHEYVAQRHAVAPARLDADLTQLLAALRAAGLIEGEPPA